MDSTERREHVALSKLLVFQDSWNAQCEWQCGDRQGCTYITSFLSPIFQMMKLRFGATDKLEAAWLVRDRARTQSQVHLTPNFILLEPHVPSHCPHCSFSLPSEIPLYLCSYCSLPHLPSSGLFQLKPSSVTEYLPPARPLLFGEPFLSPMTQSHPFRPVC